MKNYVVCAKLDGHRFLLACTTIIFSESIYNVCCLIDRNFDMFLVEQNFVGDWIYEHGTLLMENYVQKNLSYMIL